MTVNDNKRSTHWRSGVQHSFVAIFFGTLQPKFSFPKPPLPIVHFIIILDMQIPDRDLSNTQCLVWTTQMNWSPWLMCGTHIDIKIQITKKKQCILLCNWETTNVFLEALKMSPESVEYAWLALDVKVELARCKWIQSFTHKVIGLLLVWRSRLR